MKTKTKLYAGLFLGALALTTFASATVRAEDSPTPRNGIGTITFDNDGAANGGVVGIGVAPLDPDNMDTFVDPVDGNKAGIKDGLLTIDEITNLRFTYYKDANDDLQLATNKKQVGSTQFARTYYAANVLAYDIAVNSEGVPRTWGVTDNWGYLYQTDTGTIQSDATPVDLEAANVHKRYVPNYVQVTDNRIAGAQKWKLSAKLEKQFRTGEQGSDKILKGASIAYSSLAVKTVTSNTSSAPTLTNATFTLTSDATAASDVSQGTPPSVEVMSATTEQGLGTWVLAFGTETNDTEGSNGAVALTVPAGQVFSDKEYTAQIQWTLEAVA
ncbi:MAG: WxL domain-containing protein [Streptococcaceae bacterium]|jgi:hypothetical protein|nr:WxL domain-containing protein [Streptococcaceae bacterium]